MRGRGNVNLRGKKSKLLYCGCCEAWDGRGKVRLAEDERDMRDAMAALNECEVDGTVSLDQLKYSLER